MYALQKSIKAIITPLVDYPDQIASVIVESDTRKVLFDAKFASAARKGIDPSYIQPTDEKTVHAYHSAARQKDDEEAAALVTMRSVFDNSELLVDIAYCVIFPDESDAVVLEEEKTRNKFIRH